MNNSQLKILHLSPIMIVSDSVNFVSRLYNKKKIIYDKITVGKWQGKALEDQLAPPAPAQRPVAQVLSTALPLEGQAGQVCRPILVVPPDSLLTIWPWMSLMSLKLQLLLLTPQV